MTSWPRLCEHQEQIFLLTGNTGSSGVYQVPEDGPHAQLPTMQLQAALTSAIAVRVKFVVLIALNWSSVLAPEAGSRILGCFGVSVPQGPVRPSIEVNDARPRTLYAAWKLGRIMQQLDGRAVEEAVAQVLLREAAATLHYRHGALRVDDLASMEHKLQQEEEVGLLVSLMYMVVGLLVIGLVLACIVTGRKLLRPIDQCFALFAPIADLVVYLVQWGCICTARLFVPSEYHELAAVTICALALGVAYASATHVHELQTNPMLSWFGTAAVLMPVALTYRSQVLAACSMASACISAGLYLGNSTLSWLWAAGGWGASMILWRQACPTSSDSETCSCFASTSSCVALLFSFFTRGALYCIRRHVGWIICGAYLTVTLVTVLQVAPALRTGCAWYAWVLMTISIAIESLVFSSTVAWEYWPKVAPHGTMNWVCACLILLLSVMSAFAVLHHVKGGALIAS